MNWIQLHFQTNKENVELIEAILYRYGALSILLNDAEDQPLLEPMPGTSPIWDKVIVVGLFDASGFSTNADIEQVQSHITSEADVQRSWVSKLDDKAWERAWMEHYEPIQCADNLWIVPKWLDAPDPTATNILIDPGLAFGTGYHASTQLCLAWLAEQDLTDKLVIDYGCGSGILGICALKLGAKAVLAVDIDPQAVTASTQNATLNGVADRLWAGLPDEFEAKFNSKDNKNTQNNQDKADVLVANILAKPLKQFAPYFATLCQPKAKIVLAGLIEPQTQDIRDTYQPWFELPDKADLPENWIRLAGFRKD